MLDDPQKPILPHPRSAQHGLARKKQFLIAARVAPEACRWVTI
jgi:hypothetical protein